MNFFFSSRRRHTFFFQAEDGIRDRSPSRGLGDVYKRQLQPRAITRAPTTVSAPLETTTASTTTTSSGEILDLLPKISTHPSLAGIQVRCGPRNTFSPSHFVRKRRHGFLSRVRTRKGKATLQRRKAKGRSTLSH